MTNETLHNYSFTQYAHQALTNLAQSESKRENAAQLVIYALYTAHHEATFNDNVTIDDWKNINGSIEPIRKATWNDEVMRVVFGLDGGKARKGNDDESTYTASQINFINKLMPIVQVLIEYGIGTCQITGNNKLKVIGALVNPEEIDMANDLVLLNGRAGYTVSAILRNAKKILGMTKKEETTNTGDRNQSKAGVKLSASDFTNDSVIAIDKVAGESNITTLLNTATDIAASHNTVFDIAPENIEAFGAYLQQAATDIDKCGEGALEILLNTNYSAAEAIEMLKANLRTLRDAA